MTSPGRRRERMGDRLVGTDRGVPHLAHRRVLGRLGEREPCSAERERRGHDAFGVQTREQLLDARPLATDQRVGRHAHVVEEQRELLLRRHDAHVDLLVRESRRVGRDEEQGGLQLARAGVL
jgi:hypothetical protein